MNSTRALGEKQGNDLKVGSVRHIECLEMSQSLGRPMEMARFIWQPMSVWDCCSVREFQMKW